MVGENRYCHVDVLATSCVEYVTQPQIVCIEKAKLHIGLSETKVELLQHYNDKHSHMSEPREVILTKPKSNSNNVDVLENSCSLSNNPSSSTLPDNVTMNDDTSNSYAQLAKSVQSGGFQKVRKKKLEKVQRINIS